MVSQKGWEIAKNKGKTSMKDNSRKKTNEELSAKMLVPPKRKNCTFKNPNASSKKSDGVARQKMLKLHWCADKFVHVMFHLGIFKDIIVWFDSNCHDLHGWIKKEPAKLYPLWVFIFLYCSLKVMVKTLINCVGDLVNGDLFSLDFVPAIDVVE